MRFIGFCVLVHFFALSALSLTGANPPAGSRSAGMAHASVALTDLWSVHHNQAGLAFAESPAVGFYHQGGYVREMDHQALVVLVPVFSGAVATSCICYGYEHYQELKAGIAYGRLLAANLAAGIQLDYFRTRFSGDFQDVDLVTFEAGVHLRVNDHWSVATHVFNPLSYESPRRNGYLPSVYRMGVLWAPYGQWTMLVEVEKRPRSALVSKVALEYELTPCFCLRSGLSLDPVLHCFGLGYAWSSFQADLAFSFHSLLGRLPNFSLSYVF